MKPTHIQNRCNTHLIAKQSPVLQQQSLRPAGRCYSSIIPSQHLQDVLQLPNAAGSRLAEVKDLACTPAHGSSTDSSSSSFCSASTSIGRRQLGMTIAAAGGMALTYSSWLCQPRPAEASKLGAAADRAWEALGGGPADLTFPESWLGVWDITSTLVSVELPLGADAVPNLSSVRRAEQEDLNKPLRYQVAFMQNPSGDVIYDRRFNTAALLATYYGSNMDFAGRISWDPQDPNSLSLLMPGDLAVKTRVLRRSEQQVDSTRFETSEFMQQVFDTGDPARPRVKASQCYTKYKWRDEKAAEAAGGPAIVATQVVSDFLTPFDGESSYLAAANRPVTTYTYKMAFMRHHDAAQVASAVLLS